MRIKDELNSIRGIAALLVVSVHLSAKGKGLYLLEIIHHSAVPIFFFISGFFNSKVGISAIAYYKKKLRTISIIISWGFLYMLWRRYAFEDPIDFTDLFSPFITGVYPYYHLWFLYFLVPMYMISPLLKNDKVNLIILLSSLGVSLFYYASFSYWLFIYSLGCLVKKNSKYIESVWSMSRIEFGILSFVLIFFAHNNPYLRDISSFGLLLLTVKYLKPIAPILTKYSLGIYLIHPLVLDIYTKVESVLSFSLPGLMVLGIIVVVCVLISKIMNDVPVVRSVF